MPNSNFVNDPTIEDSDELWRRITPEQVVMDENIGSLRVSSAAFNDHPDGSPMSVTIVKLFSGPPSDALLKYPTHGMASITAGLVRKYNQIVAKEPLEEDPAHGVVAGKKTDSVKRNIAKGATILVMPPKPA